MIIIFGLGNTGAQYENTRHNIGFLVIDELSERHKIPVKKSGYSSLYGVGRLHGIEVCFAKPQTFMNRSGEAVSAFIKGLAMSPEDIIIVHDEIDLPLGEIRSKEGGGDAGHKGVRSISEALGTEWFTRVRIGIGRPPEEVDMSDYVLSPFKKAELKDAGEAIQSASDWVERCVEEMSEKR